MASGTTLCTIHPYRAETPATTPALQGIRNNHPTLDYDPSTKWTAYFTCVLPKTYAGGGLTVRIRWVAASATTGNVKWNAAIERIDNTGLDIDADSFASDQSTTIGCSGTSGINVETVITFTSGAQMDSVAAGETFRLRVERDAADGGDTMTGNAQITAIVVEET